VSLELHALAAPVSIAGNVSALRARAAEIEQQIAATQRQITDALLSGESTAPARAYLRAIEAEKVETAEAMRVAEELVAGEADARLQAAVDAIVASFHERIAAHRATLVVPTSPTGVEHHARPRPSGCGLPHR